MLTAACLEAGRCALAGDSPDGLFVLEDETGVSVGWSDGTLRESVRHVEGWKACARITFDQGELVINALDHAGSFWTMEAECLGTGSPGTRVCRHRDSSELM